MTLTGKINRLYQLLITEKTAYEKVAAGIEDKSLRRTVLSLAQQNNQYATELCSCMQSARTPVKKSWPAPENNEKLLFDENMVLAFCKSNERRLVTAYRKLMKESALYEGMQKMMGYQLNGILSASVQLKLLASLRKQAIHLS